MDNGELIPIGRFAEASRLSLKALRIYDRLGLLPPAYIDPRSAYRYYSREQLERARLILLLRQIDMPLSTILEVLDAPKSTARAILDAYWQEVEIQVEERRKVIPYLYSILQEEEEQMVYPVNVKNIPALDVISINSKISIADLVGYINNTIQTLIAYAKSNGAEIVRDPLGIYHGAVNEDSNGPVEICLPIDRKLEPSGRIKTRSLPAVKVAYTTTTHIQSNFPGILQAYDDVYDWIRNQGHRVDGPPWEIYTGNPDTTGPDDPLIEIAWAYH